MLRVENMGTLLKFAMENNAVELLAQWAEHIESRDGVLYTVQGDYGSGGFHVAITNSFNTSCTPIHGGLVFHDYGEDRHWQVHT